MMTISYYALPCGGEKSRKKIESKKGVKGGVKEGEPALPIKPNGERDANSQGRQKSASISAKSSKFEEKTIAIRSSLRVGALTSTKNRRVGSGQETKRATNSNGQRRGGGRRMEIGRGNQMRMTIPYRALPCGGEKSRRKKLYQRRVSTGKRRRESQCRTIPSWSEHWPIRIAKISRHFHH